MRILDLTTVVMGPFAAQLLGDMGADVIKIEAPGGDTLRYTSAGRHHGMGSLFINCNRNKRSVVLNLKTLEGRGALLKLAETADVLMANIRPQAMARLKLSYDDLRAVNPKLIYVSGFGFGQDGPYAERAAYDDLIQAMVAVPDLLTRSGSGEPRFVPINFCDRVTGLNMVNAILAALFHRERSGRLGAGNGAGGVGQAIEVPMFETMAQFVAGEHLGGHSFAPPIGPPGYARILNRWRKPYPTRDGLLCILVHTDKQWQQFFAAIGQPQKMTEPKFATLAARSAVVDEVYAWLASEIARRTTAEWLDLLARADIPYTPARTFEQLLDDPHLNAVGFFRRYEHPTEGAMVEAGLPQTWSETPLSVRYPAPTLGQHTREVLVQAGFSGDALETLVAQGS